MSTNLTTYHYDLACDYMLPWSWRETLDESIEMPLDSAVNVAHLPPALISFFLL